jgi:hypothetical protein
MALPAPRSRNRLPGALQRGLCKRRQVVSESPQDSRSRHPRREPSTGYLGCGRAFRKQQALERYDPNCVKAGGYVLRCEIVALHEGQRESDAQNYPQCVNLLVGGSGTAELRGTVGTELYTPTNQGFCSISRRPAWSIPCQGPTLTKGVITQLSDLNILAYVFAI